MSTLLREIGSYDARAASKLKKAGFQTDSEIQNLTLADLHDLFPGLKKLKRRNTIFKIIHKQKQIDPFLEKLGDVSQRDSLRDFVIKECFNRIKNTKEQLDDKQTVLKRLNDFPKDISKSLDSEKEVDFQTVPVVQILYPEDLRELFPGPEYLKLRRTIFQIIHNQTPAHLLLEELKGFTQQNSFYDTAVAERIKDTKQLLDEMQIILEAHNNKQKDRSKSLHSGKDSSSDTNAPLKTNEKLKKSDSKNKREVRFKVEVSGETFGADQQLLDEIKTPDLKWIERGEHDITIVFCPVTSRVGTDAEAAMRKVPDGDPVILVLMHYSQEPKHVSSSKVLSSYPNVLLEVNIFYHDKKKGLLKCKQYENAVTALKEELKKYSRQQRSGFNHRNHSNSGPSLSKV
ncbi:uncharacterized protein LOC101160281 [Oryzias latipes]|uniref:uncharacterized protein LOC101160281 n=1 Tax=Oryzias latipes TaxID=8090 RepID=UPI0002A49D2C|nr:uncharacterized protein LOC101160281 [Oryzias latipes]